ncbi:hypothetical protein M422DRAFT_275056 [Sphaerobolus stellatus SS14]|uniref:Uncharacterized protein n=1 Tax=Sphaerobolus stellatus (strain SS14) TaxID=990650 RepID=A0A0C9UG46_SPHS4|nr:hypothetical protein M422DRAFT_275056 [Sphaerobolus stellatus SS14]
MRLSLPLESPFLNKEDDIDELDLNTLIIDNKTAERRRASIHQDVTSRRHRNLFHIILVWLEELDPTLYPPRVYPVSTRSDINLSTLHLLRRFVAGASHDKTFEPEWTPLAIVWVTEYFELDTSLSTVSPSPPPSPPAASSPASPYPSPPLSPTFHTPPSSPRNSPPAPPTPQNLRFSMTSAVPTFSGGMKENGCDWLKDIKAHFDDARMSTDEERCEYFELKLRADAARRFEELPEIVRTNWKALEAEWKKMYPSRTAYLNTTKDIDEFYDLRITDKDLSKRPADNRDGDPEWAIAQFVEKLRYLGSKVGDVLPTYGTQGPPLESLCNDLSALDHSYIARLAAQQENIQLQLDSIAQISQANARPQRVGFPNLQPTSSFSSNVTATTPGAFTAPSIFPTHDHMNRPLRPIANNVNNPNSFSAEPRKNANSPANNTFDASPSGICQYEEAVNRWFTTYRTDATPNTSHPFPLTPGSPSPGSGECWRCGHKGHYKDSTECLRNNPLPEKEQQYRRIVGTSILNTVRNVKTTTAFQIKCGTFDDFDRNYAFVSDNAEPQYEDHLDHNPFLGNTMGDDLDQDVPYTNDNTPPLNPYPTMSDPVKLFQIQTELLQSRQRRSGHIIHQHQQTKLVHLCNSRSNLERFKHSFITPVDITGKCPIRFLATVDNGAGLCAIDSHIWGQWQRDFGNTIDSEVGAKVGSGHIIKSRGCIVLHMNVEGIACDVVFEILDSQGAFEILLGKPWLGLTKATREYTEDTLVFRVGSIKIIIPNRAPKLPLEFKVPQGVRVLPARTNPSHNQPTKTIPQPRLIPAPTTIKLAKTYPSTPTTPRIPISFPGPIPPPNPRREHTATSHNRPLEGGTQPPTPSPPPRGDGEPPISRSSPDPLSHGGDSESPPPHSAPDRTTQQPGASPPATPAPRPPSRGRPDNQQPTSSNNEKDDTSNPSINLLSVLPIDIYDPYLNVPALAIEPEKPLQPPHPFSARGINSKEYIEEHKQTHELVEALRQRSQAQDPYNPARIAEIQHEIIVGEEYTPEQESRVRKLVTEYAEIFARNLSEVRPVKGVEHRIDVPSDAVLPKNAKPLALPTVQADWLKKHVMKLLDSTTPELLCQSITRMSNPKRCHYNTQHLRILANTACKDAGAPLPHPKDSSDRNLVPAPPTYEPGWRLCNNFCALNAVTKVPMFPTGDLPAKQSKMAGHEWYIGIDLAAAYHACTVRQSDWGYLAFKVNDLGFFAWA